MLEPVVKMTVSPGGGNPESIPNEDSQVPEFTDANLFEDNRFAGLDRIENGPRVSYGMRGGAEFLSGRYLDWLLGQHYRISNDRNFPFSNDPSKRTSDYVGRIALAADPFTLAYRFRVDRENLSPKRSEIDAGFNWYPLALSGSYLSLKNDPVLATKEEITGTAAFNLNQNWVWRIGGTRDLLLNQLTSAETALIYTNECISLTSILGRQYTRDRDIKPDTNILVRVSLKNLE